MKPENKSKLSEFLRKYLLGYIIGGLIWFFLIRDFNQLVEDNGLLIILLVMLIPTAFTIAYTIHCYKTLTNTWRKK